MYSNIGKKMCILARICGYIGVAAAAVGVFCTLGGLASDEFEAMLVGLIALGGGVLLWIGSWPLYGFGQIVTDVRTIRDTAHSEKPKEAVQVNAVEAADLPEL